MFSFTVRMVVSPDTRPEEVQALLERGGDARAEPGCEDARILRDLEDEGTIVIHEQWRSAGELRRRLESTSLAELLALGHRAKERPEVRVEEVRRVWGMELLALVRRLEDSPITTGITTGIATGIARGEDT